MMFFSFLPRYGYLGILRKGQIIVLFQLSVKESFFSSRFILLLDKFSIISLVEFEKKTSFISS